MTPVTDQEEETKDSSLSEGAEQALVQLVKGALKEESFARRQEVMESRRQRFFERGDQNIAWKPSVYQFVPIAESGMELPKYMRVFNIFRPHSRSLISVLSQNPPGVNFVPDDLQQSTDVTAANRAEKMRHRVDRDIRMKDVQTEVARFFCTDSRAMTWARIEDEKVKVTSYGVLETKVPIYSSRMSDWGYAIISEEVDVNKAKDENEDIADKIEASSGGTAETSYERYARLGVLGGTKQGYGQVEKHLVTKHTAWFRPSRFRKATDEFRAELKKKFPDGVRVKVYGDVFADAEEDSMDTALAVAFPAPGDGQNRPSLMRDMVHLQEAFNHGMNMVEEHFEYGIPALWLNQAVVDSEALPLQRSEPGAVHVAEFPVGQPLTSAFFQEAPAVLPDGLMEYLTNIQGQLSQFVTGDLPSLYGGSMEDVETAKGYSMAREQAMGALSPAWGAMQGIFAQIYKQAIDALAKTMGDKNVSVPQPNGSADAFPASDLLVGSYGCYPDTDSSFPETTAAKRSALTSILTQLGQVDGGDHIAMQPDNLKLVKQLGGVDELVIPGAEARDKQLREIERLLKETPVPDQTQMPQWIQAAQQAAAAGQQPPPPPVKSSVDIDEDFDYHQPEADKVQEWLSSDERVQEDRRGNVQGVQNVRLHGLAHRAALQKAQAPPASKPPSISFNGNLLPPEVQAQALAADGIQADPQSIVQNLATQHDAAVAQKTAQPPQVNQ